MHTQTIVQLEQKVQLSGISWQTYETLLKELRHRRLRLTYNRGNLEIMVPSPEHERYKEIIGRFVETLAEELEIRIAPVGSTTFKRPELVGAEPDKSFYIRNLDAVKGKKRIDLAQDPPPDLVVEIDITSSSEIGFPVYANMGVPEIWRYDGTCFTVYQLQAQEYIPCEESLAFPNLPITEISQFLQQAMSRDYLELIGSFRWLG